MKRRHTSSERGTATLELAIAGVLILMLGLGSVEWGFALQDWLDVTAASREGARVAAAAGDEPDADCRILEAAAGALQNVSADQIVALWIYKVEAGGVVGAKQRYRPSVTGDDPVGLRCSGEWFILENNWPRTVRDNDGAQRDWVGVQLHFDHAWTTGFLWFNGSICDGGASGTCWTQETIMRIEPDPTT